MVTSPATDASGVIAQNHSASWKSTTGLSAVTEGGRQTQAVVIVYVVDNAVRQSVDHGRGRRVHFPKGREQKVVVLCRAL